MSHCILNNHKFRYLFTIKFGTFVMQIRVYFALGDQFRIDIQSYSAYIVSLKKVGTFTSNSFYFAPVIRLFADIEFVISPVSFREYIKGYSVLVCVHETHTCVNISTHCEYQVPCTRWYASQTLCMYFIKQREYLLLSEISDV